MITEVTFSEAAAMAAEAKAAAHTAWAAVERAMGASEAERVQRVDDAVVVWAVAATIAYALDVQRVAAKTAAEARTTPNVPADLDLRPVTRRITDGIVAALEKP